MNTRSDTAAVADAPAPSLFANSNYRWLWAGAALSSFGDYFTLIAMPWLVLTISGDPAALGVVMALESLPRAALMLFSGGATDRWSARTVLMTSRALFMLALLALTLGLLHGGIRLPHLYVFAVIFGLLTAFALPANRALLPQVVERSQIQRGNSALMGSTQLIQLVAPVLAGLLIWGLPTVEAPAGASADLHHIAYAFGLNAAAIFVALLALLQIRIAPSPDAGPGKAAVQLTAGFRYLREDRGMCIATLYMACVGFCAIGPLLTVLPQLAAQRLHDGALSYGLLYAVNGVGSMVGFALGGLLPKPDARRLGLVIFTTDLAAGLGIVWLGRSESFAIAAPALALIGVAASYGGVLSLSWIQERIPPALAGRILSIVMFAVMGLTPVSMALGGFVIAQWSLTALTTVCGLAIALAALVGLATPALNRFGAYPVPARYAA